MRVSLRWLEDYVRVDVPVSKLVELMDLSGTKVEAVIQPGKDLEGITVAEVVEIHEHPNADNLSLVDIRTDSDQETVVCGAKNFSVGDRVPYARLGARLPELTITERKIRGVPSRGMLCSASELGVSKDHSGILVLPSDSELGADVVGLLNLDDTILDLEITPNRPDCMGMIGIAREVGALLNNELQLPEVPAMGPTDGASVTVRLEDPEGCPRYVAHLIEEVSTGPSVGWIAARLLAAGVRPISNVVDATNYVLLETGQPLHAFDAAAVLDRTIVVRRARAGEKLTTLDGVARTLSRDDLLIADPKKALALAGIMGGEDSEVGDATTSVLLEAAYFDPSSIARTARRMGLRTEASARFERGMDPEAPPFAAARCAQLLAETAGAKPPTNVVDEYPVPIERTTLTLRPSRTDKVLGFELSPRAQAGHLRSVDLEVTESVDMLEVVVPGFRPDLEREVDLVEEVARLAGLDHLPSTVPKGNSGGLDASQVADRTLRRALVGLGLSEAWTSSLTSAEELDRLGLGAEHPARRMVALMNPMTEQEDKLRSTLLPGLLRALAHNVAHGVGNVALFEMARIYEPGAGQLPDEPVVLAAVFAGDRAVKGWANDARRWDFFEAKGVLESALRSLGVSLSFSPSEGPPFHPTRAASIALDGKVIGSIGELHPEVCDSVDVPETTVAFEMAIAPIMDSRSGKVRVGDLPRFPAALIDLAIVVDEAIAAAEIADEIALRGAPELVDTRLFDVYRGAQIAEGKKSLAYALRLQVAGRTLTDEDTSAVVARVMSGLQARFDAELRG